MTITRETTMTPMTMTYASPDALPETRTTPLPTSPTAEAAAANGNRAAEAAADAAAWSGDDATLDRVRESLRAARQQVEGAVAVLRERGAMNMDAAEAFARARSLCRRAERRLSAACGTLAPPPPAPAPHADRGRQQRTSDAGRMTQA